MNAKNTGTAGPKETAAPSAASLFNKSNLLWMGLGAVIMILGYFLMAGGQSKDPNVFNEKEVYSTIRITIAPILIMAGLIIEILAIFRTSKNR